MRKLLAVALLLGGCVVHERVPPPPPPRPPPPPPRAEPPPAPPPAPRAIGQREAVRAAAEFARERGLTVERYKAKLDRRGNWRVEMKGDRSGDQARVLVDGRSGRVLRAKLKDRGRHVDDWEWDD